MWQVVRNVRSAIGQREPAVVDEGLSSAPALPTPPASSGEPGQNAQSRVLFPDEFLEESAAPTPTVTGRRGPRGRGTRIAAYSAGSLVAGAGLVLLGSVLASPASQGAAVAPGAAPAISPQMRVDRVADTLALATGAFDLRARLFQTHQMQCPDLARGLVLVEERWTEYNAARAANGAAPDSAHIALDRSLYSSVDATERQFEQSKCPRP